MEMNSYLQRSPLSQHPAFLHALDTIKNQTRNRFKCARDWEEDNHFFVVSSDDPQRKYYSKIHISESGAISCTTKVVSKPLGTRLEKCVIQQNQDCLVVTEMSSPYPSSKYKKKEWSRCSFDRDGISTVIEEISPLKKGYFLMGDSVFQEYGPMFKISPTSSIDIILEQLINCDLSYYKRKSIVLADVFLQEDILFSKGRVKFSIRDRFAMEIGHQEVGEFPQRTRDEVSSLLEHLPLLKNEKTGLEKYNPDDRGQWETNIPVQGFSKKFKEYPGFSKTVQLGPKS